MYTSNCSAQCALTVHDRATLQSQISDFVEGFFKKNVTGLPVWGFALMVFLLENSSCTSPWRSSFKSHHDPLSVSSGTKDLRFQGLFSEHLHLFHFLYLHLVLMRRVCKLQNGAPERGLSVTLRERLTSLCCNPTLLVILSLETIERIEVGVFLSLLFPGGGVRKKSSFLSL